MNKPFVIFLALGLLCVAGYLGFFMNATKDSRLRLEGKILGVHVSGLSGSAATIVALDVRITNTSDVPFVAGSATIRVEPAAGEPMEAVTMGRPDLEQMFQYLPELGPKVNPFLGAQDRIAGRQALVRTLGARINVLPDVIQSRKGLVLRLEDVDGAIVEIREGRR